MKSKYLTAAISVAPVPWVYGFAWTLARASDLSHWLDIANAILAGGFLVFSLICCIDSFMSGKAQAAWREILGGDREGD